ncbi:MAG TPA: alpha-glucan family phosphorylase [Gemmatimonadaceae bacterium]|nr:alpha-glucan family phosphorylase [Gemmatimonadaceae bacterium]
MSVVPPRVAYFSMEIALEQALPTYSGGLGVLAGDTLRSAADLELPVVGVTLAHRRGYFRQHLDSQGNQSESPAEWFPENSLPEAPGRVAVEIEGRVVHIRAWRYAVRGVSHHEVPVYLLDTNLPENAEADRGLTDTLYGGDPRYRLCQEVVLGMGGAALLAQLYPGIPLQHHINEGHASLLILSLLVRRLGGEQGPAVADIEAVARQCIFTTHTPVPAGHDAFPADLARGVLGPRIAGLLDTAQLWHDGRLNMTYLALRCSRFINAVAHRHKEVSQEMFPGFPMSAVTNGVHAVTWTTGPMRELFDRYLPEWRRDNFFLRHACTIPLDEIREAHARAKRELLDEVAQRTSVQLDPKAFTIGFARRATPYKRADLLFTDLDRLRAIAKYAGPLQIVYGGKAHPRDGNGRDIIKRIFEASHQLGTAVRVVYLENYDMNLGRVLTSGCDVWLNNPIPPLEASGTSGMKAALNGVPSFSVLDGWWIEGCHEGTTGWGIGGTRERPRDPSGDATDLYDKLERVILPMFYGLPYAYAEVMRNAIAVNGSYFNTQRMVMQYAYNAYFVETPLSRTPERAEVGS